MSTRTLLTLLALSIALALPSLLVDAVGMRASLRSLADDDKGFDAEHSALRVVVPVKLKSLLSDGVTGIPHSQALFGIPSFGGDKNIVGELVYATPNEAVTGCNDYDKPNIPEASGQLIFLVDRGECDFVQKMRTAQKNGAAAVIIADSICQCTTLDGGVQVDKGRTKALLAKCEEIGRAARKAGRLPESGPFCESSLPYMADDGRGYEVAIPSFLISYADAQIMKDCLKSAEDAGKPLDDKVTYMTETKCPAGAKIVLSLEWDVPTAEDVTFEMWSSSDSEAQFKEAFAEVMLALADRIKFVPRYFIWDGKYWACDIIGWCGDQCTKDGRYCNSSDKESMKGVAGVAVVEENLRELCVWQFAKTKDPKIGRLWWEYIALFAKMCHPGATADNTVFTKDCSKKVHEAIPGLSWKETMSCVDKSEDPKEGNTLLEAELKARTKLNVQQLPAMVVNGALLRGAVNPQTVLGAICAGFVPSAQPGLCACVKQASSQTMLECIESGCPAGQKRCSFNKICYDEGEFDQKCAAPCKSSTQSFCPAVGACIGVNERCPECTDPAKPSWCALTRECTLSTLTCTLPIDGVIAPSGLAASSVVAIVLLVVGIAAGFGYYMWRRQREVLNAEVRSIMEEYRYHQFDDGAAGSPTGGPTRGGAPSPMGMTAPPRGYARVAPTDAAANDDGPSGDVI